MMEVLKRFILKKNLVQKAKEENTNQVFKGINIEKNHVLIDVSTEKLELGDNIQQSIIRVSPDLFDWPQIVGDIKDLAFLKDNSVDLILAHRTLNQLKRDEYQNTINSWFRVLKQNGMLHIIIPDIIDTVVRFKEGDIKDSKAIIDVIYGTNHSNYYNGFWFNRLERALREAKFRKVILTSKDRLKNRTMINIKAVK